MLALKVYIMFVNLFNLLKYWYYSYFDYTINIINGDSEIEYTVTGNKMVKYLFSTNSCPTVKDIVECNYATFYCPGSCINLDYFVVEVRSNGKKSLYEFEIRKTESSITLTDLKTLKIYNEDDFIGLLDLIPNNSQ